jgi:hypothetical protein
MMINMHPESMTFEVQDGPAEAWRCVIDTRRASPDDITEAHAAPRLRSAACPLAARSVVVLIRPS